MTEDERAILRRFRAGVDALFGDRVDRVVLYGSRARGDARPDSDYDVAVFLRNFSGHISQEGFALAELAQGLFFETGAFITAWPFAAGTDAERTPIMHEIRRDGRDL